VIATDDGEGVPAASSTFAPSPWLSLPKAASDGHGCGNGALGCLAAVVLLGMSRLISARKVDEQRGQPEKRDAGS
jgi:hypothetical protein